MLKKLAVLTSGGDSPGMNAAIRAVVRRALDFGIKVYGVRYGYEGLVQGGDAFVLLGWNDVGGILQKGGTFLGTARSKDFMTLEGRRKAAGNLLELEIEALVVIGGDGSLMGAHVLASEWDEHVRFLRAQTPERQFNIAEEYSLRVIGLPGSIDNDLYGTDMCIGADTALNHIVRALDDLSSTAASHQRTFVVETMGRRCGYLALMSALAGGASWVLIPEEELDQKWHHKMIASLDKARKIGRPHQLVVVAEGVQHLDGLPIRTEEIKDLLSKSLNIDVRMTVLGHIQRGGTPTAFDRILATRLGAAAVETLVNEPASVNCHMLGLVRNQVTATPLAEVVEKSQAVGKLIESGDYEKARELRGDSYRNSIQLAKTLSRIAPARAGRQDGAVAILTGGADAPGMNAAVSVAGRCLLNQGIPVLGCRDAFIGLIEGTFDELDWHELVGWLNRPASEIGTARVNLQDPHLEKIAQNIRKRNIKGLLAIGGWGTYLKVAQLVSSRSDFEPFNIPMVLLPASIDNNLPCTEFSIGADTALNTIVDAVDKIRHTAGATHRIFIVEVMGRECGFLALMGAMASGAEKAYLPEIGITLEDLNKDVQTLKNCFSTGKRMMIYLQNEKASQNYTTDFIRRVLEQESGGKFEVRTAVLGHIQRGGMPKAFDRILACRMAASAAFKLAQAVQEKKDDVLVFGLRGRGIIGVPLSQALQEMELPNRRPRNQWFMQLVEIADILAKHCPASANLDE